METVTVIFEGNPTMSHLLKNELEREGCTVDFRDGPPIEYRSLDQVAAIIALVLTPGAAWQQISAARAWLADWRERHPGSNAQLEDDWRDQGGYL